MYCTIGLGLSDWIFFSVIELSEYRISYWRIHETIGLSDIGSRRQSIWLSDIGLRKNYRLPTSAHHSVVRLDFLVCSENRTALTKTLEKSIQTRTEDLYYDTLKKIISETAKVPILSTCVFSKENYVSPENGKRWMLGTWHRPRLAQLL